MSYKRMTAADVAALRELIGDDERVFAGEEIHEDYSHDELSGTVHYPDVVLRVLSAEEAGWLSGCLSGLVLFCCKSVCCLY